MHPQMTNWSMEAQNRLLTHVVSLMNSMIASYNGTGLCSRLRPASVIAIRRNLDHRNLIKLQYSVAPSGGIFEVLVRTNDSGAGGKGGGDWKLESSVIRVDAYGKQGDCVFHLDAQLRPLCYCLDQPLEITSTSPFS